MWETPIYGWPAFRHLHPDLQFLQGTLYFTSLPSSSLAQFTNYAIARRKKKKSRARTQIARHFWLDVRFQSCAPFTWQLYSYLSSPSVIMVSELPAVERSSLRVRLYSLPSDYPLLRALVFKQTYEQRVCWSSVSTLPMQHFLISADLRWAVLMSRFVSRLQACFCYG